MAAKKGSRRKSGRRKYGKAAGKTVESAMRRRKRGTLRSGKGGKGGKVKSRKQAIAIGLSYSHWIWRMARRMCGPFGSSPARVRSSVP